MHKLRHGLTGGSRVRQIMTIHDGLGGGVTRLRYDIIYEQIHLKKTAKSSLNVKMFFRVYEKMSNTKMSTLLDIFSFFCF